MTEQRRRLFYIGMPRHVQSKGVLRPVGTRAFAAPRNAIVWTQTMQAQAIEHGLFLERDKLDNHVRVLPMPPHCTELDAINAIEYAAFHGDKFSVTALSFIEQQDRFGYSGAWDRSVERYTNHLTWYKQLKASKRAKRRA